MWPNPGPIFPGGSIVSSNFSSNFNVYWSIASALPLRFPQNTSFEEWRSMSSNDVSSVVIDPLIADPKNGNFTILPESSAWKLGWKEISTNSVGPR